MNIDDDAGFREVFRGELSEVDLAAGVLDGAGIECQRRWEQAGGTTFTIGETALLPGRAAVLMVPSVAYAEAREALASFYDPEADQLSDLSSEVAATRDRRRRFAKVVAFLILAPMALWFISVVAALLVSLFR
jgi:hypothetical protein